MLAVDSQDHDTFFMLHQEPQGLCVTVNHSFDGWSKRTLDNAEPNALGFALLTCIPAGTSRKPSHSSNFNTRSRSRQPHRLYSLNCHAKSELAVHDTLLMVSLVSRIELYLEQRSSSQLLSIEISRLPLDLDYSIKQRQH